MLSLTIPSGDGLSAKLTVTDSTSSISGSIGLRYLDKSGSASMISNVASWDENLDEFKALCAKQFTSPSPLTEDHVAMISMKLTCDVICKAYDTGAKCKALIEKMFAHNVLIIISFSITEFRAPDSTITDPIIFFNPFWHGVVAVGVPAANDKRNVRGIMSPLLALMHEMGHAYQRLEQNHYYKLFDDLGDFSRHGAYYEASKKYPTTWLDDDNIKMNEFAVIKEFNSHFNGLAGSDPAKSFREPIRKEYSEMKLNLWDKKSGIRECDAYFSHNMGNIRTGIEALVPSASLNLFSGSGPNYVKDISVPAAFLHFVQYCEQLVDPHDAPRPAENLLYCSFEERLKLEMELYSKKPHYDMLINIFGGTGTERKKSGDYHLGDAKLWYEIAGKWQLEMGKILTEWEEVYDYLDTNNSTVSNKYDIPLNHYTSESTSVTSVTPFLESDIVAAWESSLEMITGRFKGNVDDEKVWYPYYSALESKTVLHIADHLTVSPGCNCKRISFTPTFSRRFSLSPGQNRVMTKTVGQWRLAYPTKDELADIGNRWSIAKKVYQSSVFQVLVENLMDLTLMKVLLTDALGEIQRDTVVGANLVNQQTVEDVKFLVFPGAPGGMTPVKLAGDNGASEMGDNTNHSIILWDPFSDFIYYADHPTNTGEIYAERVPAWVVLGHELGHLMQYEGDNVTAKNLIIAGDDNELHMGTTVPHLFDDVEHPLCNHGTFGKRSVYGAQSTNEFTGKTVNGVMSKRRLNIRHSPKLTDWVTGVLDPDVMAKQRVIGAALRVASITENITGQGQGGRSMERCVSNDIFHSLSGEFRSLSQ